MCFPLEVGPFRHFILVTVANMVDVRFDFQIHLAESLHYISIYFLYGMNENNVQKPLICGQFYSEHNKVQNLQRVFLFPIYSI